MSEIPVKTSMLANGASTVTVRKKVKDSRDSEVSGDSKVRYVREDHVAQCTLYDKQLASNRAK